MKAAPRTVCRLVGDPIWGRNDDALSEPASIPCDQTGSCRRSLRKAKPSHEMTVIVQAVPVAGTPPYTEDRTSLTIGDRDMADRPISAPGPRLHSCFTAQGTPHAVLRRTCHPIDSGMDRSGTEPRLFKRGSGYCRQ